MNWREHYKAWESALDDAAYIFVRSPVTLALFVVWTLLIVAFGFWAGMQS